MRILKFEAQNIKKLRFLDIAADPFFNQFAGANEQGKTSALDAIWMCVVSKAMQLVEFELQEGRGEKAA